MDFSLRGPETSSRLRGSRRGKATSGCGWVRWKCAGGGLCRVTLPAATLHRGPAALMNVLVAGGAGFTGAALVERLPAGSHRVAVVDNGSGGDVRWPHGVSAFLEADVVDADPGGFLVATKPEAVVHLAARTDAGASAARGRRHPGSGVQRARSRPRAGRTGQRSGLSAMSPRRTGRRPRKQTTVSAVSAAAAKFTAMSVCVREKGLRGALFGVLGLLLLTPFVVTPGTIYPFVVGKALWSRALIEIAFALWAVLALMHPGYRPPRSWVLALLAVGFCVSLLSAGFGVSPGHSLWSDYERMQGLVDRAHWVALAVVLASVLHIPWAWRAVFKANLAAGTATACIVIARALEIEVPYLGAFPEFSPTRFGGPFGNPGYLSIYMLVNLVLAAGFAAQAWATAAPPGEPGGRRGGCVSRRRSRGCSGHALRRASARPARVLRPVRRRSCWQSRGWR